MYYEHIYIYMHIVANRAQKYYVDRSGSAANARQEMFFPQIPGTCHQKRGSSFFALSCGHQQGFVMHT